MDWGKRQGIGTRSFDHHHRTYLHNMATHSTTDNHRHQPCENKRGYHLVVVVSYNNVSHRGSWLWLRGWILTSKRLGPLPDVFGALLLDLCQAGSVLLSA